MTWPTWPTCAGCGRLARPAGSSSPPGCRVRPSAGRDPGAAGLQVVRVAGFSRREALSYLGSRLADYPDQRVEALDLGEDLDGLPLGLAQAAAVMNVNRLSCREYRTQLGERRKHMSGRHRRRVGGDPGHLVAGRRMRP